MPGRPEDYVCVLTRGHMFDPESCIWALQNGVHYVGMMGCAGKNSTVHDLVVGAGITETDWDRVKRPIGLSFGAKTPAELAIAIVGELVDVRYRQRWRRGAGAPREEPGAGIAALARLRRRRKAVGKRGAGALPRATLSVIPCFSKRTRCD